MGKRRPAVTTLFLDSSALFTAVNSPTGGSAKLFTLKNIQLFASPVVLTEVERNIKQKLRSHHQDRFLLLVEKLVILPQHPNKTLIKRARKVIVEKDAIILAEAKNARTDYLITLDKKDFLIPTVVRFIKPTKIATPKMFFSQY